MNAIRKTFALVSSLSLIVFVYLVLVEKKSPAEMLRGYLEWLKDAPVLVIVLLFLVLSAGSSRVITFGIVHPKTSSDTTRGRKIFWLVFALAFGLQMVGWFMIQRR